MNFTYFTGEELNLSDNKKGGLYLVGSCNFNPISGETFYWIKVGVASNFKKRMSQYRTYNPMLWKNSYYFCDNPRERLFLESKCHEALKKCAIGSLSEDSEWYEVDRETYLKICNKGFSFFYMALHDDFDKITSSIPEIIKKNFEDEFFKTYLLEEMNAKSHCLFNFLMACS